MSATTATPLHDVIGVGFGPSNMALAIALEELAQANGLALNTLFLEKQRHYRWHGETLIGQSRLQISFLKDLVSLRNPTSAYSFINYLHTQERLVDFINRGTFHPCRMEFNDYLRWVAEHFREAVRYGEAVLRIEPGYGANTIDHLRVIARDEQGREATHRARAVVLATGGTPRIPPAFAGLGDDPRIFHHSRYLSGMRSLPCAQGQPMRIAVIGSGQSAAEAFIDLHDSYPSVDIEMVLRASALKPADDSPFVNEIFDPAQTDRVFAQSAAEREQFIAEYRNTNYSVVDLDLIERIYEVLYRQKIARQQRHSLLCRHSVEAAKADAGGFQLTLRDLASGQRRERRYDAVILATGYERRAHNELLAPLLPQLRDCAVDRDYRVLASDNLKAAVYLQGFCESSHGLSDTLLSVLPMRSAEIGRALYRSLLVPERAGHRSEASLLNA